MIKFVMSKDFKGDIGGLMNFKKSMEYLKTGNSALYKKDKISTVKIKKEKLKCLLL